MGGFEEPEYIRTTKTFAQNGESCVSFFRPEICLVAGVRSLLFLLYGVEQTKTRLARRMWVTSY